MSNQSSPDQQPLITQQEKASLSKGAREIRGRVRDVSSLHKTWQLDPKGISPVEDLLRSARWASDEEPEKDND